MSSGSMQLSVEWCEDFCHSAFSSHAGDREHAFLASGTRINCIHKTLVKQQHRDGVESHMKTSVGSTWRPDDQNDHKNQRPERRHLVVLVVVILYCMVVFFSSISPLRLCSGELWRVVCNYKNILYPLGICIGVLVASRALCSKQDSRVCIAYSAVIRCYTVTQRLNAENECYAVIEITS